MSAAKTKVKNFRCPGCQQVRNYVGQLEPKLCERCDAGNYPSKPRDYTNIKELTNIGQRMIDGDWAD